jgi:hypothetical protein
MVDLAQEIVLAAGTRQRGSEFRITERAAHRAEPATAHKVAIAKPLGRSPTWKPRLVKMPVPIMFAITMQVAVSSETLRARPGRIRSSRRDVVGRAMASMQRFAPRR